MKTILKSGRLFFLTLLLAILFAGCAQKETVNEYNKSAVYWYNKMLKEIAFNDLEAADDTFISLESEHRSSPLIPTAIFIIANAHIVEEEYELAKYYLDEYIKRFGRDSNIEYIRYLKIKANFFAFDMQDRNQLLVIDTLNEIEIFLRNHSNSPYVQLVRDIYSRMNMAQSTFDTDIADLYERIDKPKAEEFYLKKARESWEYIDDIEPVDVPFYREIFEIL